MKKTNKQKRPKAPTPTQRLQTINQFVKSEIGFQRDVISDLNESLADHLLFGEQNEDLALTCCEIDAIKDERANRESFLEDLYHVLRLSNGGV